MGSQTGCIFAVDLKPEAQARDAADGGRAAAGVAFMDVVAKGTSVEDRNSRRSMLEPLTLIS